MSDMFFVGAELITMLLLLGAAIVAFRTKVFPTWWAAFGTFVGVVLLIGPIGWAGLIFGLPLWTLATTALLVARAPRRAVTAVAPAVD